MLMINIDIDWHLALINQARGLYGGIFTEVVSTDRTPWGYTHDRDQDSPNRPTELGK